MGKCPFCKGEVQEDLLRFGGPCPHCFNTIPGEEAATDPGAKQRAAEAAAEKKQERKRNVTNLVVAAVVLLLAVGGGLYYRQQQQKELELLTIQFDTTTDIFTADPAEWDQIYKELEELAQAQQVASTTPGKPKNGGSGTRAPKPGDIDTPDRLAEDGGPTTDVTAMSSSMGAPIGSGSTSLSASPMASLMAADLVLKDEEMIAKMIKAVMRQNSGQLVSCYEETLKVKPDFKNYTYMLYFTLNPDGTTSKVSVASKQVSEPGFELCVTNKIKGWKFMKVNVARPIEYPYVLKSGG